MPKIEMPKSLPLNEIKKWVENFDDKKSKNSAIKVVVPSIKKELNVLYPGLNPVIVPCQKADISFHMPVFIAYSEKVVKTQNEMIVGFRVLIQNPRIVNKEGIRARNYETENGLRPSQDQLNLANKVVAAWSKELWEAHSNLSVITVSGVKSRRKGCEAKLCIVLSCSSKGYIPIDEKPFPKTLKANNITVDVDVREGFFELGPGTYDTAHARNFHQRLKMGCNISGEQGPFSGTMGPFVDLENDKIGFLTCAHALFKIQNNFLEYDFTGDDQKNILQPAVTTNGNQNKKPCGHVVRAVFNPNLDVGVDAAVVEITDRTREPVEGLFALEDTVKHMSKGLYGYSNLNFKNRFNLMILNQLIITVIAIKVKRAMFGI